MDELIWFIIIIFGASVLERFLKAAQRRQQQQQQQQLPPSEEEEWEPPVDESAERRPARRPATLQDLIAEQLGLSMERRPQVRPPEPERPALSTGDRAAERTQERGAALAGERRAATARRKADEARRKRLVAQRRATQVPVRGPSLEQGALLERGEAVSLERPRRPEDHERFHDRYGVAEPVVSHEEFHQRYVDAAARPRQRGSQEMLPDRPDWSSVQRAIIWAEILGPPKGL